jgi:hypothetical protein|tara:strand:+ start:1658 stop:2206 length:549 start_codon:yes stop_codon:yes gene_type:complete
VSHIASPLSTSEIERINQEYPDAIPRGNFVHLQAENFHLGRTVDFTTEHTKWVEQLINEEFWERWQPVPGGVETAVADSRFSIGGKLDCLVQHHKTNELAIVDYKTKRSINSATKNHAAQLGGYCSLIGQSFRNIDGWITKGFIFNVYENRVEIDTYDIEDCLTKWVTVRDLYFKQQPSFDF